MSAIRTRIQQRHHSAPAPLAAAAPKAKTRAPSVLQFVTCEDVNSLRSEGVNTKAPCRGGWPLCKHANPKTRPGVKGSSRQLANVWSPELVNVPAAPHVDRFSCHRVNVFTRQHNNRIHCSQPNSPTRRLANSTTRSEVNMSFTFGCKRDNTFTSSMVHT